MIANQSKRRLSLCSASSWCLCMSTSRSPEKPFCSLTAPTGACAFLQQFGCAAEGGNGLSSTAAAAAVLQIFKMTTETAYDAKAYDQKMQE